MFKVFKSKEISESNNTRDILEDFNKYQFNKNNINNNTNMINNMQNNNINNNINMNNMNQNNSMVNNNSINNVLYNNIKTIDLNQSIIEAQKLREQHLKSYKETMDSISDPNEVNYNNINKENLDYTYSEQVKKYNALDNVKNIINNSTDNIQSSNMNNNVYQQPYIQQNPYTQNVMYNTQQYPNMINQYQQFQGNVPNNPYQFSTSDIIVSPIPVQNFSQHSTPQQFNISNEENKKLLNPELYTEVEDGYRRCGRCGQKLREDYKQCFVCGTWLE